jgi:energy-coupling factor transport system ATP-binding protein
VTRPARRGPLRPIEVAEAAVLADVTVALCLLGWLLPVGGLLMAVAVTPMAAIAVRNRPRAVIAGGVAGMTVAFLIAGSGLTTNVAGCAVLGSLIGASYRRRWGVLRTVGAAVLLIWPPVALGSLAMLAILTKFRRLALDQINNTWTGMARLLRVVHLGLIARRGDTVTRWAVGHWWVSVPAVLLASIVGATWVARVLAWPVLDRLSSAAGSASGTSDDSDGAQGGLLPPGPVPVQLTDVVYRYPGAERSALRGVSLNVDPGQFVAVVGPNGSGKSTLARVLGGRRPTSGHVSRPGAVAAGQPGGTSVIFQRPESQVLGVRVRDDVVWGLPPGHQVDVLALLDQVGLRDLADRETSTLSGGELQRLAVAAAMARRPRLLISDEATAMVDADGRLLLTELYATLARDEGLAVVHVTHRPEEAARTDRALTLDHGRLRPTSPGAAPPDPRPVVSGAVPARPVVVRVPAAVLAVAAPGVRLLRLEVVGHVYSAGSPWANTALDRVDLTVTEGEGVLVVGPNGSGKSTLAWILAGLLIPSRGRATLEGVAIDRCIGRVALSFQHPRLQLLRTTVHADVKAASGADDRGADAALLLVGLDPVAFRYRRVDQLSGGQQRRVALAGMLARKPRVLVLDEPFAGLDAAGRAGLIDVLARLRQESGLTLLIISHDLEHADQVVDRLVSMAAGSIVADGPIEALSGAAEASEASEASEAHIL